MAMRTVDSLIDCYPADVQSLARAARTVILRVLSDAEETVDGSASVIGYGYRTDYRGLICTIILSKSGVKLGLAHGAALSDPDRLLEGAGKVHRFVQLRATEDLRKGGLIQLLMASSDAARARLA